MKKIKSLFSTPKKAICSLVCALLIVGVIGAGSVYAAGAVAESSSIGEENAKNFAYADAGVDPALAQDVRAEFDYEQGQFVYEVEFTSDNTEYEYWIRATDGAVVKKDIEVKNQEEAVETTEISPQADASVKETENADQDKNNNTSEQIDLETAKNKALTDAGVSASDATFTTAKLDYDDGIAEYEIDFYTSTHEYDYEINAETGDVISKDVEAFKTNKQKTSGNAGNESSYIGVDKAKSIAVDHAGFSVSKVTFSKAKFENDDGYMVYEVEFYKDGREYEYTIDASKGTILEYDSEYND